MWQQTQSEDSPSFVVHYAAEQLDQAVERGRITREGATELVNNTELLESRERTQRSNASRPPRGLMRDLIRATAQVSDIRIGEVRAGLRDGQSLAEIAAEHGQSGADVVQVVADRTAEKLDRAVERGRITREAADERLERLIEQATELVNRSHGDRNETPAYPAP